MLLLGIAPVSPPELTVYVQLVWIETLLLCVVAFFLGCLFIAMRRSRRREAETGEFSLQTLQGQENERRRLFCEIHDTVLPKLRRLSGGEELERSLRGICEELFPPDFTRLSFRDSLASLCASFMTRTGLRCETGIDDTLDVRALDAAKQLHVYRIVQEALTNIEKHAHAGKAVVVARNSRGGGLFVSVSDDGQGLDPDAAASGADRPRSGLGMETMRRRAQVLGAGIEFLSPEHNGLHVRLNIPPV